MTHVDDPRLDQTSDDLDASPALADASLWRDERLIRALNVVVATVGLIITLPLWLLIGLIIRLTSRGPIFYSQTRVGLDARALRPHRHDSRRREDIGATCTSRVFPFGFGR